MCTVDLFPVPETFDQPGSPASQSSTEPFYRASHACDYPLPYYPLHPYEWIGTSSSIQAIPTPVPNPSLILSPLHPSKIPADAVYQIRNHIITKSSKLTSASLAKRLPSRRWSTMKARLPLASSLEWVIIFLEFWQRRSKNINRCLIFCPGGGPGRPHVMWRPSSGVGDLSRTEKEFHLAEASRFCNFS